MPLWVTWSQNLDFTCGKCAQQRNSYQLPSVAKNKLVHIHRIWTFQTNCLNIANFTTFSRWEGFLQLSEHKNHLFLLYKEKKTRKFGVPLCSVFSVSYGYHATYNSNWTTNIVMQQIYLDHCYSCLSLGRMHTEPQGVQDGGLWEGELHGTPVGDKWWLPLSASDGLEQQRDRIHASSERRVSLNRSLKSNGSHFTGFWHKHKQLPTIPILQVQTTYSIIYWNFIMLLCLWLTIVECRIHYFRINLLTNKLHFIHPTCL